MSANQTQDSCSLTINELKKFYNNMRPYSDMSENNQQSKNDSSNETESFTASAADPKKQFLSEPISFQTNSSYLPSNIYDSGNSQKKVLPKSKCKKFKGKEREIIYEENPSDLFTKLDINFQEFKSLVEKNLGRLNEEDQIKLGLLAEDTKFIEISKLSLKLEDSKLNDETGELNDTKLKNALAKIPANNYQGTISYSSKPFSNEPDIYSSNTPKRNDFTSKKKSDMKENVSSVAQESTRKKQNHQDSITYYKDGLISSFKEDYSSVLENLRNVIPGFNMKSNILRYLTAREKVGTDFLYSVILEFKEFEKYILLLSHQFAERERHLNSQLENFNENIIKFETENLDLKKRLDEKFQIDNFQSTNILNSHVHSAITSVVNYYEEKLSLIEDTVLNPEHYHANKSTLREFPDYFVDLKIDSQFEESNRLLVTLHTKLRDLHKEICRKSSTTCDVIQDTDKLLQTLDENDKINEDSELYDGDLNEKEVDKILKQKEKEIKNVKQKEKTYQQLIYSLAKELSSIKKSTNYQSSPISLVQASPRILESSRKFNSNLKISNEIVREKKF